MRTWASEAVRTQKAPRPSVEGDLSTLRVELLGSRLRPQLMHKQEAQLKNKKENSSFIKVLTLWYQEAKLAIFLVVVTSGQR